MIFWSLGRGCDNEKLNESLVKKGLLILKGKQIIPVVMIKASSIFNNNGMVLTTTNLFTFMNQQW
jgi:hypothetical protein